MPVWAQWTEFVLICIIFLGMYWFGYKGRRVP